MNSPALNFFLELWNRLRTKSPKFFRILQLFAASLTLLGYVPTMLQSWFDVGVADHFETMCKDISKYATGFFLAASLPGQSTPVAKTEEGTILKTTDEKTMPFTAAHEVKKEEKTTEELPVIMSTDINKT